MEAPPPTFRWLVVLPNLLSLVRLVLAGVFPFLPSSAELFRAGAVIGAAATDALDGFIARRFHATTWQGSLLDAAADKLFVVSVLFTLVGRGELEIWQALVLFSRDLTVGLLAGYAALRRWWWGFRVVRPRLLGKATTVLLFAVFLSILAAPQAGTLHMLLGGVTAVCSALAACDYLLQFTRAVRVGPPTPAGQPVR